MADGTFAMWLGEMPDAWIEAADSIAEALDAHVVQGEFSSWFRGNPKHETALLARLEAAGLWADDEPVREKPEPIALAVAQRKVESK